MIFALYYFSYLQFNYNELNIRPALRTNVFSLLLRIYPSFFSLRSRVLFCLLLHVM